MSSMTDPLRQLLPVAPDDDNNLPFVSRAIWVGTAGDLAVTDELSVGPTIIPNLTVGWHPLQIRKIWATNTAASGIVIGR